MGYCSGVSSYDSICRAQVLWIVNAIWKRLIQSKSTDIESFYINSLNLSFFKFHWHTKLDTLSVHIKSRITRSDCLIDSLCHCLNFHGS